MSFFKKYNGSTHVWLVRMERATWVFIYGGLLSLVLATFMDATHGPEDTALYWGGGLAVLVGVVLIYVRSHLKDDA